MNFYYGKEIANGFRNKFDVFERAYLWRDIQACASIESEVWSGVSEEKSASELTE